MSYKICLDPGHGGKDPGACNGGRRESDDTLQMALEVGRLLTASGMQVYYTRTSDTYDGPTAKAQKANGYGVDLLVSFHRNAASASAKGAEVLIYSAGGKKEELAQALCQRYSGIGFVNRGVKLRNDLSVLKHSQMPAILLEIGFISNDSDNALYDANHAVIAQATAEEIKKYFGIQPKTVSGWVEQDGRWWYRNADGSYPVNAWKEINGKWYYFGKDGWTHTGWLKYNGMWFYMAGDGSMVTGLHKINGNLYVLNSEKGSTEGACMKTDSKGALSVWKE